MEFKDIVVEFSLFPDEVVADSEKRRVVLNYLDVSSSEDYELERLHSFPHQQLAQAIRAGWSLTDRGRYTHIQQVLSLMTP